MLSKLRFQVSVSLDGYMAGPSQSEENPLGIGGMALHEWAFELEAWRSSHGIDDGEVNPSSAVVEAMFENVGATIMGRNMFGGGPGPWPEPAWDGWWGEDPPYHMPVYVLTHHEREPLEMTGGTTFHFVTEGIEVALSQAREAAAGKDVLIGGGASTISQFLAAGEVDEFLLSVTPVILGSGERPLDGLDPSLVKLEPAGVIDAPGVTHLSYRVTAS